MYGITGATGKLGRHVVSSLLERVAPRDVIALVRDPAKAADLRQLGIDVRRFDYDEPDQLVEGLAGVARLLLISSNQHDRRVTQHKAVVDAANRAEVELFAYTSIIHADDNPMPLAVSHRETERMIVDSGLRYAMLRNSWYTENYLIGADTAIEQGVLHGSTGEGGISAATRTDYAAGAAAVLTGTAEGSRVYELAGDEAFTLADLAAVLGDIAGKTVRYDDLSEADYRDALLTGGMSPGFAATLAEYSALAAGGTLKDVSRTLSGVIGRPTETMRDFFHRTLTRVADR